MILFVLEGAKTEPRYIKTIKELYFPNNVQSIICTYKSNIYSLYDKLKKLDIFSENNYNGKTRFDSDVDTISVLKDILQNNGDDTLKNITQEDVSEIYLFFDYDFQQSNDTLENNNQKLLQMLEYFSDETKNGKLYINYPMIESLFYTKKLPDEDYYSYTVRREECINFKRMTTEMCRKYHYSSYDYLLLSGHYDKASYSDRQKNIDKIKPSWQYVINMNILKANYISNDKQILPEKLDDIAAHKILLGQLDKYVNKSPCRVSVLNSFPVFLYEYFGLKLLQRESN